MTFSPAPSKMAHSSSPTRTMLYCVFLPDVVSGLYGEVESRLGCHTEGYTLTLHGLCAGCRGGG